jgi:hypothetical protein
VEKIKNCYIENAKQNRLFDHKAMTICFKPPPKVIRQPTISREILKDPELDLVVRLSVADTYAIHSDTLTPEERESNRQIKKNSQGCRVTRIVLL